MSAASAQRSNAGPFPNAQALSWPHISPRTTLDCGAGKQNEWVMSNGDSFSAQAPASYLPGWTQDISSGLKVADANEDCPRHEHNQLFSLTEGDNFKEDSQVLKQIKQEDVWASHGENTSIHNSDEISRYSSSKFASEGIDEQHDNVSELEGDLKNRLTLSPLGRVARSSLGKQYYAEQSCYPTLRNPPPNEDSKKGSIYDASPPPASPMPVRSRTQSSPGPSYVSRLTRSYSTSEDALPYLQESPSTFSLPAAPVFSGRSAECHSESFPSKRAIHSSFTRFPKFPDFSPQSDENLKHLNSRRSFPENDAISAPSEGVQTGWAYSTTHEEDNSVPGKDNAALLDRGAGLQNSGLRSSSYDGRIGVVSTEGTSKKGVASSFDMHEVGRSRTLPSFSFERSPVPERRNLAHLRSCQSNDSGLELGQGPLFQSDPGLFTKQRTNQEQHYLASSRGQSLSDMSPCFQEGCTSTRQEGELLWIGQIREFTPERHSASSQQSFAAMPQGTVSHHVSTAEASALHSYRKRVGQAVNNEGHREVGDQVFHYHDPTLPELSESSSSPRSPVHHVHAPLILPAGPPKRVFVPGVGTMATSAVVGPYGQKSYHLHHEAESQQELLLKPEGEDNFFQGGSYHVVVPSMSSHHHWCPVHLDSPRHKSHQVVYNVKFKRTHRNFVLAGQAPSHISVGAYVKVEADRGEDLGIVLARVPAQGAGYCDATSDLKKILRLATKDEISMLKDKARDEEALLRNCRAKVRQRGLNMNVIDAEYQFDRHKVIFFFEAEGRVDFRELVRDLFSIYKTRIWMQQIDKVDHDPTHCFTKLSSFGDESH